MIHVYKDDLFNFYCIKETWSTDPTIFYHNSYCNIDFLLKDRNRKYEIALFHGETLFKEYCDLYVTECNNIMRRYYGR